MSIKEWPDWLKGLSCGILIFLFLLFVLFTLIIPFIHLLYPCHGDLCGLFSFLTITFYYIIIGAPIIIGAGALFGIYYERFKKIIHVITILIAGIILFIIFIYLFLIFINHIKANFPETKDALLFCTSGLYIDQSSCNTMVKLGKSLCQFGSDEFKTKCNKYNAAAYNEPALCENHFSDPTPDSSCNLGMYESNNKLMTYDDPNCCYYSFFKYNAEFSECNKMDYSEIVRGFCLQKLAIRTKDLQICNEIENVYIKDKCYMHPNFQDSNVCSLVSKQEFEAIAPYKNNQELCFAMK